jgi:hypothetical protein
MPNVSRSLRTPRRAAPDNVIKLQQAPTGVLHLVVSGELSAVLFDELCMSALFHLRAVHGAVLVDLGRTMWGDRDAWQSLAEVSLRRMREIVGARQLVFVGVIWQRPFLELYQAALADFGVSALLACDDSQGLRLAQYAALYCARPQVVGAGQARARPHA